MQRISIWGGMALVWCSVAATAHGEQQVKLESGATLVGNVSLEGPNLVVDVDGAKLEVPFTDVVSVTRVGNDNANHSDQLLVRGLESQILSDGKKTNLGILEEAFRLAPDDPRVAFWYARTLLADGNGKGARDVLEPRRAAIAAAYPGIAERLADEIEARVAAENDLPAPLLERLDQIAAAAKHPSPIEAEATAYAAYFRLIDQADEPLPQSAFCVNCNGENERLESFDKGYYLFTFSRRRSWGNNTCRLEVTQPELALDVVEFNGSSQAAENVGVLRVERMGEADRQPVVVSVVDPQRKPLAGATIACYAVSRRGDNRSVLPVSTTAEGTAQLKLFPNEYNCQVSLPGYCSVSKSFTVAADAKDPVAVEVTLYPAVSATIKVAWRSKLGAHPGMPQFAGDAATTGEFEQHIGPDGSTGLDNTPYGPPWVRLTQNGTAAQLQFTEQMHFPQAGASWVGRWERSEQEGSNDADSSEEAVELFDLVNLAQLDAIKNELKLERTNLGGAPGRGTPVSVPVEAGDIYLGKLNARDPQTGRPALIEFKIVATELHRP